MKPDPRATYRVQLHPDFGFDRAAGIVPYLRDLGISHVYTSPCLQAAEDSSHGYDMVDPTRVNGQLGGSRAHARWCGALEKAGMGQIIDVVPNHMAIAGGENPWWQDVLENGVSSRFASFFDVDWDSGGDRWPGKLLLPVLGDHYGRVLENGDLHVSFSDGVFSLHYFDHVFPLAGTPRWLSGPAGGSVEPEAVLAAGETARLNQDPDALDALMDRQHYRLAFWRMANTDLGYRRFFDISDLAGIRVEDRQVFDLVHALPVAWVRKGWVQGLRIDHPDGLRDPAAYLHRLQTACPGTWVVVEKILDAGETLPPDWPVAGTTGYDFLNLAGGLLVDPGAEAFFTRLYETFTGETTPFEALVQDCKRLVLNRLLASELKRLTRIFETICERHRCYRDFSRDQLYSALLETAVHFPVYRTYVSASPDRISQQDRNHIAAAIEGAVMAQPDQDPDLYSFLGQILALEIKGPLEQDLVMRFQQLTGPAMAKGFEDTALYRYHRLVCLNEVGGDPDRFGTVPRQFHSACLRAQERHPSGLLSSTTHDTKRSEDVRWRLALLSEIPERWSQTVTRWKQINACHRVSDVPDANTEYLLYQTLVGAWPIGRERITAYMKKAAREAKRHTSWINRNQAYESGLAGFIEAILDDPAFCTDLEAFVAELVHPGRINSLAQTLIKLTAPGVPDIYQGTELWDLSLVDPDNRRPVDFDRRRRMLNKLPRLSLEEILAEMDTGLPKLWVIRQALHLRRRHPEWFGPEAGYQALYATGAKADHLVAFSRSNAVITLAPRRVISLDNDWEDTALELPPGDWTNLLTGETRAGGRETLKDLLGRFPVGLLTKGSDSHD